MRWMGWRPNGERRVEKNKLIISILMYTNDILSLLVLTRVAGTFHPISD